MASATSKETEIKLVNVARASLEELLVDYHDYLKTRSLRLWDKNSKQASYVRRLGSSPDVTYDAYRNSVENRSGEIVANIIVCLIHQANYLLDRQLRQLQSAFLQEGGIRERMTRARLRAREQAAADPGSHRGPSHRYPTLES